MKTNDKVKKSKGRVVKKSGSRILEKVEAQPEPCLLTPRPPDSLTP